MNQHFPTEEDFRRIQEALAAKIRTGEQLQSELNDMVSSAAGQAIRPFETRIATAETALSSVQSTVKDVRRVADTATIELNALRKQIAGLEEALIAREADIGGLGESVAALQAAMDLAILESNRRLDNFEAAEKQREFERLESVKQQTLELMEHAHSLRRSTIIRDAVLLVLGLAALLTASSPWFL